MKKRIYLASPHMGGEELTFVKEAFQTNWIAPLGPNVDAFEYELAHYVGSASATALSSGTSAIHLALKALHVQRGDFIFCSTLTFVATCNPILYEGAVPVFIDSDEESWNMCPKSLEKAFHTAVVKGALPKAVIVVHLYGQSAKMDEIKAVCAQYAVPIIEDAAESLGATYKGKQTGTLGDFGVYSFNGNKIITTSGGGMLVSDNSEAIQKVRFWATQAREKTIHYEHKEIGYNYRMSNVAAGIGRGQLQILQKRIEQKRTIFSRYEEAFQSIPYISMMNICEYGKSNYWLSVITLDEQSPVCTLTIIQALEEENIEARPVWKPMHMQPLFQSYDFFTMKEQGSVAEQLFQHGICLPSDTKMTEEEQQRVISIIKKCIQQRVYSR